MAIFDFGGLSAELQAKTDAELAAILPILTTGPIKVKDSADGTVGLITWLRKQDLAYQVEAGDFIGPIKDASQNQAFAESQRNALRMFLGHIARTDSETLHTNQPDIAALAAGVLAILKGASIVTDAQIAAFYALDGGLAYPGVTEAEITTSRANYTDLATREAALNAVVDKADLAIEAAQASFAAGDTAAEITTAANTSWGN